MKYYAVKNGYQTGIYNSWAECQSAVKGFSNPEFKSFKTKEEAIAYLNGKDAWTEKIAQDNAQGYLSAFTDGSYSEKLNRYSYGVVLISPDGTESHICGSGSNPKYIDSKNIIGEILGVLSAVDWAISNKIEKIKIYHDYEGLSKWITGSWKTNSEASRMYARIFRSKYDGLITVEFEKVPGHSSISYNNKADRLAKSALTEENISAIQGENWYSIPFISQKDFSIFEEKVKESDNSITSTKTEYHNKTIHHFKMNFDIVTVTLFKGGNHKLLVQGKNTYLFQVIAAALVEINETGKAEQILGSAYRIKIDPKIIDKSYNLLEQGLPADYPINIKRLIRQSIINLNYSIESEDYTQYAFPALRALEGHIKYLIKSAGGNIDKSFKSFNRKSPDTLYYYTGRLTTDPNKKEAIEICYNYYKSERDTALHYGNVTGAIDNTRIITDKYKVNNIIKKCLALINQYN